jgi:hypothetical protein
MKLPAIPAALRAAACALLWALTPWLVSAALLHTQFAASHADLAPFWSDELFYTQQARAFARAGLHSGYFTVNEQPARLAFSRYYVWGPFVPAWYALWGGGSIQGIFYANAAWLAASAALAALLWRPGWRTGALVALLLALYPPLLLLYPSSMQEGLHYGLALLLAPAAARALRAPAVPWPQVTSVCALLLLACLARPTWGLALPLYLALARGQGDWRRALALATLGAALVLPVAVLFQWSGAPYPHFRSELLAQAASLPDAAARAIAYAWESFLRLFSEGQAAAFLQRAQVLGLLLGCAGVAALRPSLRREALFHAGHLCLVYGAVLALHETTDGRDFRVVAPHLLLALLVMAWRRQWLPVASVCAATLLASGPLLAQYRADVGPNVRQVVLDSRVLAAAPYNPAASGWCNTVSLSFEYIVDFRGHADTLLSFGAGIGLSWINPRSTPATLRAGYLLLTDDDARYWGQRLALQPLLALPGGALYRSVGACPGP